MSTKRPTEAPWDSDDDLLQDDFTGTNAFTSFKDEDIDEDVLLGDGQAETLPYDDTQDLDILEIDTTIGDEFDEEFKTEQDVKEETVIPRKSLSQIKKEPIKHETETNETLEHEEAVDESSEMDQHAEEAESDSDSEEKRDRFKTERKNIVTLKSQRTSKQIPDTLEISAEDQAKIEEFMTNKPQKKWQNRSKESLQKQHVRRAQHDNKFPQRHNRNQVVRPLLQVSANQMSQPTPLLGSQPFQRFNQPRKIHINPHFQGTVRPPVNAPLLNQRFQNLPPASRPLMIQQGAAPPFSSSPMNQVPPAAPRQAWGFNTRPQSLLNTGPGLRGPQQNQVRPMMMRPSEPFQQRMMAPQQQQQRPQNPAFNPSQPPPGPFPQRQFGPPPQQGTRIQQRPPVQQGCPIQQGNPMQQGCPIQQGNPIQQGPRIQQQPQFHGPREQFRPRGQQGQQQFYRQQFNENMGPPSAKQPRMPRGQQIQTLISGKPRKTAPAPAVGNKNRPQTQPLRRSVKDRLGLKRPPPRSNSPAGSTPGKTEPPIKQKRVTPMNDQKMTELERKLEQQRQLRETIKRTKEMRRQQLAPQRRAILQQKLAQKGLTISDVAGDKESEMKNTEMQAQQVMVQQPPQPQQHQEPTKFITKQQPARQFHQRMAVKKIINKAKINQVRFGSPKGQNLGQVRPQIGQNLRRPQNIGMQRPQTIQQTVGSQQIRPAGQTVIQTVQFKKLYPGFNSNPSLRGASAPNIRPLLPVNNQISNISSPNVAMVNTPPEKLSPILTKISTKPLSNARIISLNKNIKTEPVKTQRICVQTRNVTPVTINTTPDLSIVKREVIDVKPVKSEVTSNKLVLSPTSVSDKEMARAVVHSLTQDSQRKTVIAPKTATKRVVLSKGASTGVERVVQHSTCSSGVSVSIGNLTASTSRAQITQLCLKVGPVKAVQMNPNEKSARVCFEQPTHAATFVERFNRHMVNLSHITCQLLPP